MEKKKNESHKVKQIKKKKGTKAKNIELEYESLLLGDRLLPKNR